MLEDAELVRLGGAEMDRFNARPGNSQHFSGFNFAHIFGIHQVERAGLRCDGPRITSVYGHRFSQGERPEPSRIPYGVDFLWGKHQQRIRTFYLIQSVAQCRGKIPCMRAGNQMHDYFGVAVGLENRTAMFQPTACSNALVRFPLCATAILPLLQSIMMG